MASGQVFVLTPSPPGLKYALEDIYTSSATATGGAYESMPVWAFNAATAEHMDLYGRAVGYGGSGLTLYLSWLCTVTATEKAVWGAGIRRLATATDDFDAAFAYDYNYATDLQPANAGFMSSFTITFTDGSDMNSLADGEAFVLRLRRNATATGDTHTTNGYIAQGAVSLKET